MGADRRFGDDVEEAARRARREREPLSRRRIIAAALVLVDEEGLGALSMRRVASELGYEAMSLYRHLPNKRAVIEGIVEAVMAELEVPPDRDDPWDTLRELARALRALADRHPNVFPVVASRPVALPTAMWPVECALDALRRAGFDEQGALKAFRYLLVYVYGAVLRELGDRGTSDTWHWYEVAGYAEGEFPRICEVAPHVRRYDWTEGFDWGLEVSLTGLQATLGNKRMRAAGGGTRG
jgi:AcrR family transcriptional regulator